jgi:hypothetical protein
VIAGPITKAAWAISDSWTAAGAFSTGSATKLMASLAGAKRFVVRMSGRQP